MGENGDRCAEELLAAIAELSWEEPVVPHLPLRLRECCKIIAKELTDTREQLVLAVRVAEAARWACVAVLDSQTSATELRPLVAEQLLEALKAYDDDREKRGLVSVSDGDRR